MFSLIEKLFDVYYSPLCNYASRIVGNADDAEDIVQSLFAQFLQKNNLQAVKVSEAYLLRSVKNKCIDFIRAQKKLFRNDSDINYPALEPNDISEEEIEPLFYYYAAKLPPKTREVFLMSRVNKLTYKEIAEELRISQKTVENQMGSALKKLKIILQKEHYFLLMV
ncbi:MAG: RNA polymerase sigma-70 factor [Prolixibacteraceae bacterium]|nr:RNA polymerase sigma-70 factor [Prolixibacteraceae bacterium]